MRILYDVADRAYRYGGCIVISNFCVTKYKDDLLADGRGYSGCIFVKEHNTPYMSKLDVDVPSDGIPQGYDR